MEESGNDSAGDIESQREVNINAPDGGWGWVIVLSAFVINVITDGCSYSFGVLFTYLLDYFNESRSTTAWIGSVFCAVPLLCGPISSLITNRIGIRKATVIGGLITAVGFIGSAFVDSVYAMAVTYGCIAGFGISLPYLNSIVVVAQYFEKKRTLATGIAECGAGIGTLIFAPLYESLIQSYGWRGAVLIIGAISLNIVVCGAVFRPIKDKFLPETNTESDCEDAETCENITPCDEQFYSPPMLMPELRKSTNSLVLESNTVLGESVATTPPVMKAAASCLELQKVEPRQTCINCLHKHRSLVDLSLLLNPTFVLFITSNVILYFWYDVPYVFTVDRAKLYGITEKNAAIIVAVIGVTHTIGNLLFGFLGDRKKINRRYLYSGSLILTGGVLAMVPLFTSFVLNTLLAGMFGLLSASAEALTSVITVDILGIEKLTDAYGIVMFLQGVANLIGPPFAGWLYDTSGNYDNTFLSAGICIAISGIIVFLTAFRGKKANSI